MTVGHKPEVPNPLKALRQDVQQQSPDELASVERHLFYYGSVLEAGVNLRLIQEYLGHNSPATTSLYTHLTVRAEQLGAEAINRVISDL